MFRNWVTVLGISLLALAQACGDALVITKAASATTIAEIHVEKDGVRIDLEIGEADVPYFRPALVEAARQDISRKEGLEAGETGLPSSLAVVADDIPLKGELVSMKSGHRLVRDPITGEPLAEQPEPSPVVVEFSAFYPFPEEKPQILTFERPPSPGDEVQTASIGFMAYHLGLPVNDFRYFPEEVILDLNWEDEWYSAFRHPNLRRQNYAPLSAYLYVDSYEVRKEIILRPRDLARFTDLPLGEGDTIPVTAQEELKTKVVSFLEDRGKVLVDGEAVAGTLDRIHFVKRTLRTTGIVDPPEDMPAGSATLGVIFSYPVEALPDRVELHWDLFDGFINQVPAAATDEAGPLPAILTPEDPELIWNNHLKNPQGDKLRDIPSAAPISISLPVASVSIIVLALVLACRPKLQRRLVLERILRRGRPAPAPALWALPLLLLVVAALTWSKPRMEIPIPGQSATKLPAGDEKTILGDLLFNVYRSFDARTPEDVFDRLARSISGDLLEDVYLETRESIRLENQGGLQVKIAEVEILDLERLPESEARYRCRWRAHGSVGHWGHLHQRSTERLAEFTLAPIAGSWKIVAMDLINES